MGIILCKHSAPAPREVLGSTAAGVLGNASDPLVLVPPSGEQHRGVYNMYSSRMTGRPGTALG